MNVKLTIQAEYCKADGTPLPESETLTVAIITGNELCPDCIAQQALNLLGAIEGIEVFTQENERRYHYTAVYSKPPSQGGRLLYRGFKDH
jgi:hypothetical protein